jgi:hypothetical protein
LNFTQLSVKSRSQWARGLRHEPSSLPRTLRSWVRIPLKAWMSVCAFILCLCCPVCADSDLATGWSQSKESYQLCKRLRNWIAAKFQQRAVEPLNEWMSVKNIPTEVGCWALRFGYFKSEINFDIMGKLSRYGDWTIGLEYRGNGARFMAKGRGLLSP